MPASARANRPFPFLGMVTTIWLSGEFMEAR
jgi:hypothetical protein